MTGISIESFHDEFSKIAMSKDEMAKRLLSLKSKASVAVPKAQVKLEQLRQGLRPERQQAIAQLAAMKKARGLA